MFMVMVHYTRNNKVDSLQDYAVLHDNIEDAMEIGGDFVDWYRENVPSKATDFNVFLLEVFPVGYEIYDVIADERHFMEVS
jgi:hypothetical protein